MYNPKEYWSEAGKQYVAKSERQDELINLETCIHKHLPDEEKILEVGSGNGRVYDFLQSRMPEIEGRFKLCDFADFFRDTCKQKTGILPAKWDGESLPYADNQFAFIVSFSVLLHVPTSDIARVFREHIRVAKQFLFVATWFEKGDNWKSHGIYFRHNYHSLFADNNLEIIADMKCSNPRRANWLLKKRG